ncbi:MAG: rod shape-determining protein MreC [candidate division Zixibacteria bacterium]|nr:rod shape-determining protein MreC [candidate division Zixibacteria bacterium]
MIYTVPGSNNKKVSVIPSVLIILCLALIVIPTDTKIHISEIIIKIFYLPPNSLIEKFEDLYKIREKAKALETELVKTKLELSHYADAALENQRLREFLNFKTSYNIKLIPAEIVEAPDLPYYHSVIVNVGKKSGLRPDLAAISTRGLAGKVSRVYDSSAEIQLLLDPLSRVSVVDTRSRVQGILKVQMSGELILDNVPSHEDVKEGDTLKTSGLGGVYPPGIPAGVVTEFEVLSPSYLFAQIKVQPFAEFSRMERLFIIDSGTR